LIESIILIKVSFLALLALKPRIDCEDKVAILILECECEALRSSVVTFACVGYLVMNLILVFVVLIASTNGVHSAICCI
jgi:hypothetical protein